MTQNKIDEVILDFINNYIGLDEAKKEICEELIAQIDKLTTWHRENVRTSIRQAFGQEVKNG